MISLKLIVEHPVRMDILCCLADGEPLTIGQISARVGRTQAEIKYHTRALAARDLVTLIGEVGDETP